LTEEFLKLAASGLSLQMFLSHSDLLSNSFFTGSRPIHPSASMVETGEKA